MDHIPLRNSDVLILTNLSQTPHVNPDSMLGEFCLNISKLKFFLFKYKINN
jgi:integrator complex subunit 9